MNKIEDIQKGLGVCSVWIHDEKDSVHKDCRKCPYKTPEDPCGLYCGEKLMNDASMLIDLQRNEIESLKSEVHSLNAELKKVRNEA